MTTCPPAGRVANSPPGFPAIYYIEEINFQVLLYSLVKIFVRLALRIFCTKTTVTGKRSLQTAGPLLLVANHPNSFLDAIIIGAQFPRPVYFLARGDAFHRPWHNVQLRLLNMIPVYRLSEGKENLHLNEEAFRRSTEILAAGGIVLIFIEGICVNKHELQPFKKGAARIGWNNRNLPQFSVLPIAIRYDSFVSFGKEVLIQLGNPLSAHQLFPFSDEARNQQYFNKRLLEELLPRIEIPAATQGTAVLQTALSYFAAVPGWLIHAPLYYPLKHLIRKKTSGTVFYDSVLFGSLLLLYPMYLLLLCLLSLQLAASPLSAWLFFLLAPFAAYITVQSSRNFSVKHAEPAVL